MASLIAWFLLRRQRSRSRTRSRPPPSASESGGEVEYDAAEAEGEGRGKPTESVGQLTVVASRGESPERKFVSSSSSLRTPPSILSDRVN